MSADDLYFTVAGMDVQNKMVILADDDEHVYKVHVKEMFWDERDVHVWQGVARREYDRIGLKDRLKLRVVSRDEKGNPERLSRRLLLCDQFQGIADGQRIVLRIIDIGGDYYYGRWDGGLTIKVPKKPLDMYLKNTYLPDGFPPAEKEEREHRLQWATPRRGDLLCTIAHVTTAEDRHRQVFADFVDHQATIKDGRVEQCRLQGPSEAGTWGAATSSTPAVRPSEPDEEPVAPETRFKHILVIEDEPVWREVALSVFPTTNGYTVHFADDPNSAIAAMENHIDLVLADVLLKDKANGLTAVNRIRRDYGGVDVVIWSVYGPDDGIPAFNNKPLRQLLTEHELCDIQDIVVKSADAHALRERLVQAVTERANPSPSQLATAETEITFTLTARQRGEQSTARTVPTPSDILAQLVNDLHGTEQVVGKDEIRAAMTRGPVKGTPGPLQAAIFALDPLSYEVRVISCTAGILPGIVKWLFHLHKSPIRDLIIDNELICDGTVKRRHKEEYRYLLKLFDFESVVGKRITVAGEDEGYALFVFHENQDHFSDPITHKIEMATVRIGHCIENLRKDSLLDILHEDVTRAQTFSYLSHDILGLLPQITMGIDRGLQKSTLAKLIKNLETYARLLLHGRAEAWAECCPQDVIKNIVDICASGISFGKIRLGYISQHPRSVPMNSAILRFIVTNLVRNAAEHSLMHYRNNSEIVVEYSSDNQDSPVILVHDSGPGIHLADRADRVFRRGFTTKSKGTGMGLTLADRLLRSLGGRIYV